MILKLINILDPLMIIGEIVLSIGIPIAVFILLILLIKNEIKKGKE